MKKKLALIVISLDECFTKEGFSGGGHKVTKHLVLELVDTAKFDIDIYCKKSSVESVDGVNSITVLKKKTFKKDLEEKLKETHYDYVLSSDVLLPFANNVIHSNSSKYKSKNGKNALMRFILKFYNSRKIKTQEQNMPSNKAVFTVSESLKDDYIENFGLDKKNVFVCYPSVDSVVEASKFEQNKNLIIGSMAGGGLNKGGYLLLMTLAKLPRESKIRARIIFPKFKKSFFFRLMVNLLGLKNRVEVLPKQKDMNAFYKSVDCYVLPSLNEAFGLVVTEAASNYKPSLASSTTGVSELIVDGENGFVFDRINCPVKNLLGKLMQIEKMYFNDFDKFVEISKKSRSISDKLVWRDFGKTIIENMVEEA